MVLFCSAREFDDLCCDIAEKADTLRLQAKGGSMHPFIQSGDWVDAALCKGMEGGVGKGDIILFRKDRNLYMHRVLRRTPEGFVVKGDMSIGIDGVIPVYDVLAKVTVVRRGSRRIDLRAPVNRLISFLAAEFSMSLQYPFLIVRKAGGLFMKLLSLIQGAGIYRAAVRTIFPLNAVIRAAGPEDEEGLRDLYRMAGHDIRDGLARVKAEGFWLIAQCRGKVAGGLTMTRYEKDPGLWVIFGLEVKPVLRGMGTGRALIEAAVSKAQASGARRIGLFVNKKARAALALYHSSGFKEGNDVPPGFNLSPCDLYLSCDILSDRNPHGRLAALLSECAPGWDRVLDKAVAEGVFYPLYKSAGIPEGIREEFKQIYYLYISRSCDFISRVERILGYIESLKIHVLLFKGPAIDSFIYDDFMRPRLDLDLAVRDGDMVSLEAALRDLGYVCQQNEKDYPLPEYLNSRLFMPPEGDLIPVHVHRHLINNMFLSVDGMLSMDMEMVWDEAGPFKGYRYISMLKPELNIVFLCEHGLKHDFDQLVYLYEIERLIGYYGGVFSWSTFVRLAQNTGLDRPAYYGLYFVKELLSGHIPAEVLNALRPSGFTQEEKSFIKNMLRLKRRRYASFPVYCAMRRGVFKKAFFIFRTLFPPEFALKGYMTRIKRLILP